MKLACCALWVVHGGWMILPESLLLAILGTGLGILIGLWMGYVLVGAMYVGSFVMQYEFP